MPTYSRISASSKSPRIGLAVPRRPALKLPPALVRVARSKLITCLLRRIRVTPIRIQALRNRPCRRRTREIALGLIRVLLARAWVRALRRVLELARERAAVDGLVD